MLPNCPPGTILPIATFKISFLLSSYDKTMHSKVGIINNLQYLATAVKLGQFGGSLIINLIVLLLIKRMSKCRTFSNTASYLFNLDDKQNVAIASKLKS